MFAVLPNQSPLLTNMSRLAWIHGGVKNSRKKCDLFSLDFQDKFDFTFFFRTVNEVFFQNSTSYFYIFIPLLFSIRRGTHALGKDEYKREQLVCKKKRFKKDAVFLLLLMAVAKRLNIP